MFGLGRQQVNSELIRVIKEGALLVDVRSPMEFNAGSAEGAINIPLEEFESSLDKLNGHDSIVLFCRSGGRSGYGQMILQSMGYKNVYNGGVWQHVKQMVIDNK